MGKKSLFEPTTAPEKEKNDPAPVKEAGHRKTAAVTEPSPEPENRTVTDDKNTTPDQAADMKSAAAAGSSFEPETRLVKTPAVEAPSSETKVTSFEADVPSPAAAEVPFENDPLVDGRPLLLGVAGVCGLILIILIASMMNADNYYVKQTRGAVEVWKGDFSPLGKDRIMILHGTHWDRPVQDSYSMEKVFSFAIAYYLEKVRTLAEAPVSDDFDRITYYLERSLALAADEQFRETATLISQIGRYVTEARVLQTSGEKEAISLAQEKLTAAGRMLTGLIADLAEEGREAEDAASGH